MKIKPLGKVDKTARGFEIINFKDCYDEQCSLQQSSLADCEIPGTSAIWLGCDKAKNHPATNEPLSPRMHLKPPQVVALITHLQTWLDKGTFKLQ